MKKRIVSILLTLALLCSLLPASALPVRAETTSGTCGDNLTWSFDSSTGKLTITGSGKMTDWNSSGYAPWYEYRASIKSLSLPSGLTSIGKNAFRYCTSLTSVTIPDSVTSIGNWAFYYCESLTSVTIPNSVTSIGNSAFQNCTSLTSVTIPNSVTSIGDSAFRGCTGLTSVSLPASLTSISYAAFLDCTSLTSVTIPNSVTSIGSHAFCDCTALTSVTIPDSVTSIGDLAFYECSSLASIAIPSSVTSIGDWAFYWCTSLTKITVASGNPNYSSDSSGVLFNKNKTELICCPGGFQGSYAIPSSVTSIGSYAFLSCASLTSVTIPNSVTSIGDDAFYKCTSLTSIAIMNPACQIYASSDTLGNSSGTTIYGYSGSTAENYANRYGYQFDLISNFTPPAVLTDEIIRLIFADMAYARIPVSCEGDRVNEWLAKKTYLNVTGKAGYDKQEMEEYLLFNNSDLNRVKVYQMVGDWLIADVIEGEGGYAAVVFQKGNDIVIAYRGSEEGPGSIGNGEDWWVDAEFAIFNVLDGRQFKAALEDYYYWADLGNVTLTGHSLGGALVAYVSTLTGAKGYSFDGAAGHVIDLAYLFEPLNIDFHSKDYMSFVNYTDPKQPQYTVADLIQHTNEDLFPGICYYTNENANRYDPDSVWYDFVWTHQPYSNTIPSKDGTVLEFMPLAEEHRPKDNWYASVDYENLGIATGGISGFFSGLFGGKLSLLTILKNTWKGVSWGDKVGRLLKAGNVHLGTADNDTISVKSNITHLLDITAVVTENVIYGGDGADILIGASGPDLLVPGRLEGDSLSGGAGSDIYLLNPETAGSVYISDSRGADAIVLNTEDSIQITALGFNKEANSYAFRLGDNCTVFLRKTLFKHSYSIQNIKQRFGSIDSHGGISNKSNAPAILTAEAEPGCKEISVEGLCTVRILDPEGNLAATYSTDQPGLYPEEFGTVYISVADGVSFLTGTIYESWTVEINGDSSVIVAIIGTDDENYVNRISLAEDVDLSLGEATVFPDQHLVVQDDEPVALEDQTKTVAVTISQTTAETDVGETIELTAEALFADGTATDAVYWVSSDPSVLTCEQNSDGTWCITAVDSGKAELYAVAEDSGNFAACEVTASYRLPCSGGISCPGKGFEDMPPKENWAHNPIDWAVVSGITKGTSATTFSPAKTCTRCEVVTFLWRAAGCPEPTNTNNPFTDVPEGSFYYKAVLWAVEKGITSGTGGKTFSPKRECTRSEVVTFLWRAAGKPEPTTTDNPFKDVVEGSFYYKAVLWAVEHNITKGTSATTFAPKNTCTRGEIVTFLYRAYS